MSIRTWLAARRHSGRWALLYGMVAGALVFLLLMLLVACTSAPPREITLSWVASPSPAATCASMGLPYRDGGCVVSYGDRCTIVTAATAVQFAQLGRQFKGCLE